MSLQPQDGLKTKTGTHFIGFLFVFSLQFHVVVLIPGCCILIAFGRKP